MIAGANGHRASATEYTPGAQLCSERIPLLQRPMYLLGRRPVTVLAAATLHRPEGPRRPSVRPRPGVFELRRHANQEIFAPIVGYQLHSDRKPGRRPMERE